MDTQERSNAPQLKRFDFCKCEMFKSVWRPEYEMSRSSSDRVCLLISRVAQSSFKTAIAFAECEFELFVQVFDATSVDDSVIPITATIHTVHRVEVVRVPREVVRVPREVDLDLLRSQGERRKSG